MALLNDAANKLFASENSATYFNMLQDTFNITYNQILDHYDEVYSIVLETLIFICFMALVLLNILFPIYYLI